MFVAIAANVAYVVAVNDAVADVDAEPGIADPETDTNVDADAKADANADTNGYTNVETDAETKSGGSARWWQRAGLSERGLLRDGKILPDVLAVWFFLDRYLSWHLLCGEVRVRGIIFVAKVGG